MEIILCIISLCLNVEWSFKCKYGIKSVWGFLTSAQQYCQIFGSYFFYNNLMLFAWAGFVSAAWTFVFDANESHLNMSERETDKRARQRKCVFRVCLCGDFWTEHQKHSKTTRQLVLFASYPTQTRIHSVYTLTTPQHTHENITQTQQIIHPSFMLGCTTLQHPFVNCS